VEPSGGGTELARKQHAACDQRQVFAERSLIRIRATSIHRRAPHSRRGVRCIRN